jgi:hypothetical protein
MKAGVELASTMLESGSTNSGASEESVRVWEVLDVGVRVSIFFTFEHIKDGAGPGAMTGISGLHDCKRVADTDRSRRTSPGTRRLG